MGSIKAWPRMLGTEGWRGVVGGSGGCRWSVILVAESRDEETEQLEVSCREQRIYFVEGERLLRWAQPRAQEDEVATPYL